MNIFSMGNPELASTSVTIHVVSEIFLEAVAINLIDNIPPKGGGGE